MIRECGSNKKPRHEVSKVHCTWALCPELNRVERGSNLIERELLSQLALVTERRYNVKKRQHQSSTNSNNARYLSSTVQMF